MIHLRLASKLSVLLIGIALQAQAAGPKWQGTVPAVARDAKSWTALMGELSNRQMFYGTMAASARMLVLFTDLPTKELAYKGVINLVDQGYPFSAQPLFLTGDITPAGDYDFVNSYNLYKSILNRDKGMEKWAGHYLENIDKENFSKYLFYQAIESYSKSNLKEAEEKLSKLLQKDLGPNQKAFTVKIARTLARVYFDQEQYAKSLDIYQSFLLKLNPISPTDWLEASWNLYYLKKYNDALGMLYNLESKSSGAFVNLEKYTIRALAYRNLCALQNAETLISSFERDFGSIIRALKRGEAISRFPQLFRLEVPGNEEFRQISLVLAFLRYEASAVQKLPRDMRPLASYLYQSEINMLNQKRKAYMDGALERAANRLIMMGEHLKFLRFDVQRERFNPDVVFKQSLEKKPETVVEDLGNRTFRIKWNQYGDYWRDERLKYLGAIENACGS